MSGTFLIPAWRRWLLAGVIASAAAGAALLFVFDPEQHSFFPLCPFHLLTGWSCPGCGALRAIHQLAHGNLTAAWRFNPLLVSLLPGAAWLGLREWVWQLSGKKWPGLVTRPFFGWALVTVSILFSIVRNLPGFHI